MRLKTGLFLLASLSAAHAAAYEPALPAMTLTAVENGLQSQPVFSCHGKIHGYLRLKNKQSEGHVLESRWISPNGKLAADSANKINFEKPGSTAYVWFEFPEASLLGGPDTEVDKDRLTFSGPWQVEIRWDDKVILTKSFNVQCP
jgi:hypothetical protein